jgi:UDP-GlcNAc3NAcA epimerase
MKKKILTVIGARPQIIKAAAISRAIASRYSESLKEVLVHTGQHYDHSMSEVFFGELGIPQPKHQLQIAADGANDTTPAMLSALQTVMQQEAPAAVLVYGDTNSTLAAAIAAAKLHIPVIHVEAGLRSFNKKMPEEINRILTDHVSTILFVPTKTGMENLMREGFKMDHSAPFDKDRPGIFHCGDVMYDNSLYFSSKDILREKPLPISNTEAVPFVLATVHRDHNTDNPDKLSAIIEAFISIAENRQTLVVWPVHPRTRKMLELPAMAHYKSRLEKCSNLKLMAPVSYLEMIRLEAFAKFICTDSGGVQKEAFFFKKPCIILREQTEWQELVDNGNAILAGTDPNKIIEAFDHFNTNPSLTWPEFYGDGHAADFICNQIIQSL